MSKFNEILKAHPNENFYKHLSSVYDDAIIGIINEENSNEKYVIVYSKYKFLEIMMNINDISYDKAKELFKLNYENKKITKYSLMWVDDTMFNYMFND